MYYYTAFDNKILLQQIVIHKEKIILAWTFSQILIKPIMKFLTSPPSPLQPPHLLPFSDDNMKTWKKCRLRFCFSI